MNIFEFKNYKDFFNSWVNSLPKEGRGEYRRLATKLNVSTTMISQVFKGDKQLSLELASDLCDYLGLNEVETEYFFYLVQFARAGNYKLQQKLLRRLESIRREMQKLETRLKKDKDLTDETRQIYYSSWIYTAIRNLVALPKVNDVQAISEHLGIPIPQVQRVVEFLLREGLINSSNGKLDVGARRTHIGNDSGLVVRHHQNWRIQGFQKMALSSESNLFYTAPMSLSEDVAQKVREELPAFIEKINKWVVPSPSEVTRCLTLDWFEF